MLLLLALPILASPPSVRLPDAVPSGPSAAAGPPLAPDPDGNEIREFVGRWCLECHAGPEAEAAVDFERALLLPLEQDEALWLRAARRLEKAEMPPRSAPRPEPDELVQMAAKLRQQLERAYSPSLPPALEAPSLRRLTRSQLRHGAIDLLGVDPSGLERWPADPLAHGFDHLPESLALDERALERQLEFAEEVAQLALPLGLDELPGPRRVAGRDLSGGHTRDESRVLSSQGKLRCEVDLPRAGRYRLSAWVFADQAGDEPARAELWADQRRGPAFEVRATAAPGERIEWLFEVPAGGSNELAVAFINDFWLPADKSPDGRAKDRNLGLSRIELEGPLDELPASVFERSLALREGLPLRGQGAWPAALPKALLERLMRDLWRGAGSAAERREVLELAGESSGRGALRDLLIALLASPHFHLDLERSEASAAAGRPLEGSSLITRLALLLLDAPPDEELLARARPGLALDPDAVEGLARELLADPRAARFVRAFGEQWLGLRALEQRRIDRTVWPDAPEGLLASMAAEPLLLLEAVLRERRPIRELLDARFTFVDRTLADWYGLPAPAGAGFERVSLSQSGRRGLLTQAAILTLTSDPARTTPVKRGKWVLETLLGSPPPPPPPGVGSLDEVGPASLGLGLRARLEQHRRRRDCAACHAALDPLGLALEGFDALGRARDSEQGQPIDTRVELADGRKLSGARELVQDLATPRASPLDPSFARGLSERLLTYALARPLAPADRALLGRLVARGVEVSLEDLLIEIVRSESFRLRAAPPASR
jgi:hypothetical protein